MEQVALLVLRFWLGSNNHKSHNLCLQSQCFWPRVIYVFPVCTVPYLQSSVACQSSDSEMGKEKEKLILQDHWENAARHSPKNILTDKHLFGFSPSCGLYGLTHRL